MKGHYIVFEGIDGSGKNKYLFSNFREFDSMWV